MKALFLIFHGFEEHNGISKKILYQIQALKDCGIDTHVCYLNDINDYKTRMIDTNALREYGSGIKGKIFKRIEFGSIIDYVKKNQINFIYLRYDHNANPFTISLFYRLKKTGSKIAMEIPTYPYDQEYKGLPLPYQRILFVDKCFRKFLARYIDKIVTFSDYDVIWGKPTIRISNGIDFDEIKVKEKINDTSTHINLIAVATIHPWHGFDRAIKGLIEYYQKPRKLNIHLHIIGSGVPIVLESYRNLISEHMMEDKITLYGPLYGEKLDQMFELCDMGIGSLARHRSKITKIKTLKNREYAARGIPFVYSETDNDFESMPYIMKASADDNPLDIEALVRFYHSVHMIPSEIRSTIEKNLTWKKQMQIVLNNI